jgi:hypothetical protein
MPQWGMGKGLQNVVNSWVNVNNNHVVFPGEGENGTRTTSSNESRNSAGFNSVQHQYQQGSEVSRDMGVGGGVARKGTNIHDSAHSTVGMFSASSTGGNASSHHQALSGRSTLTKTRGKLKRTNSHSDLLKEKAAARANSHSEGLDTTTSRQYRRSISDAASFSGNMQMASSRSLGDNTSVRRMSIESMASESSRSHAQKIINTGQYVNENAFANQHRSMQLAAQRQETASKSKKQSPARSQTSSAPPPTALGPSPLVPVVERRLSGTIEKSQSTSVAGSAKNQSSSSVAGSATNSANGNPPAPHAVSVTTKQNNFAGVEDLNCNSCEESSGRILALEADLEYLRAAALNSEYLCVSCERKSSHINSGSSVTSGRSIKSSKSRHSKVSGRMMDSNHSLGTRTTVSRKSRQPDSILFSNENLALAEASRRLVDITARHKRQVEHMSREMGRSQNDMHLKLSKLAMMCKDLNDESAKRKEQVDNVKQDLDYVREERNELSSELEILRARVQLYEKQEAENAIIRRLLQENQDETLAMADQAISERDSVIKDLTSKLVDAMVILRK